MVRRACILRRFGRASADSRFGTAGYEYRGGRVWIQCLVFSSNAGRPRGGCPSCRRHPLWRDLGLSSSGCFVRGPLTALVGSYRAFHSCSRLLRCATRCSHRIFLRPCPAGKNGLLWSDRGGGRDAAAESRSIGIWLDLEASGYAFLSNLL